MMTRIEEVLADALPNITFEPMINIAHNYAAWENHFGHDVIVHRKGATLARKYNGHYSRVARHCFVHCRGFGQPRLFLFVLTRRRSSDVENGSNS